ncbi:MAG: hypothetical protein ACI9FG_000810 [Crocinitomicaceae bacterium]|jgi:hypothetical protein
MKKFFLYFLGIIFVFLLILMLYLAKFADQPIDDFSDLEPVLTEVPQEENGFPLLIAELNTLSIIPEYEELTNGMGTKTEYILAFEKLYKSNPQSLERISQAIAKPYIQEPVSFDMAIEYLSMNLIYLSKILSARIHYHQANQQPVEALETYNKLKSLSVKYTKSDGAIVIHIIATHLLKQLQVEQFHLLTHGTLDSEHLFEDAYFTELLTTSYTNTINCECRWINSALDNISGDPGGQLTKFSSNGIAQAFFYQPNKTKNTSTEILRLTKQLPASDYSQRKVIGKKISDLLPKKNTFILSGNYIGNEIIAQGGGGYDRFESNFTILILKNRTLNLLLSLRSYSSDHANKLPDNLADLVPQYIASIPLDPFTDKPLLYSKKKKLIWSLGSDLHDNLGVSAETLIADERDPLKTLTFEDEPHLAIPF